MEFMVATGELGGNRRKPNNIHSHFFPSHNYDGKLFFLGFMKL
jgi:hypothetical protein